MHVTIAKLTESEKDKRHIPEEEVFAENPGKFDDGVTEHHGDDFDSAVDELCRALSPMLYERGTVEVDGKKVPWIDLDVCHAAPLFAECWKEFQEVVRQLSGVTEAGFRLGNYNVESAVQRLREAYDFDWMYVLDDYCGATPVSAWLRALQKDEKYHGGAAIRRFYVHATYDGDQ
jgi:hypothetical protein